MFFVQRESVEIDEVCGKYSKMNLDKAKKLMTSKNRKQGVKMVMTKGLCEQLINTQIN